MKHIRITLVSAFVMLEFIVGVPADATVIDLDAQAANRGGNLTGIPDSPLTIGVATFTGGELLNAEVGLDADKSGVYASEGSFGSGETNPLLISFTVPVQGFSVHLLNGDDSRSYTASDDLGDSVTLSLSSARDLGASTFSLAGVGLRAVTIASANADAWDFSVDDISFAPSTPIPEPEALFLVGAGFVLLFSTRPQRLGRWLRR